MTAETKTATFYLAFNEDGDVAGDMDRDAAIERLRDEYGANHVRVVEMAVTIPEIRDIPASLVIPPDKAETVEIRTE